MTKLYIGRNIRELREQLELTQAQVAQRLNISTSYLNQVENNQRAASASVLLGLAEQFNLDISSFSRSDGQKLVLALREAFADPIFEGQAPGMQELKLVANSAPNLTRAFLACHQALRISNERLTTYDHCMAKTASFADRRSYEEVREFFYYAGNYFDGLDLAAEALAREIGLPDTDPYHALAAYAQAALGLRVVRSDDSAGLVRKYDAATRTLTVNAYSAPSTRSFQIAYQIAQETYEPEILNILKDAKFNNQESYDFCKVGLRNYFAGAVLMPYESFVAAAMALRHDLALLAARYGASVEQVAHRLSTLQRPARRGVPVFFARFDRAGNIVKRHSASKLQFPRFGAACPLWSVHRAFERPGTTLRQLAETPDGHRYLLLATEISKEGDGFDAPRRQYAIALGCEIAYAKHFVQADSLNIGARTSYDPIGVSCRVCERPNCQQRAMPPMSQALIVDHDSRGAVPYEIAG